MGLAELLKESGTFERMNGHLQLLPSNKMTHYFKEWTTPWSVLKKNIMLFWKLPLQGHMSTIALLKVLLYLMNNCNYCCEIVISTHSPWNNEVAANAFVHLTQYFSNKFSTNFQIIATSSVEEIGVFKSAVAFFK